MVNSLHRIRSFVLRAGRMTESQQRGWDEGWSRFGLKSDDGQLDWSQAFVQPGRQVVEIGFGMGDSLLQMAQLDPATNFVGIEVHRPGVGKLLNGAQQQGVCNLRVYAEDAVDVLERSIAADSLDALHIYFPDPWHKKRHNKRRLIQPDFVASIIPKIKPSGLLHLATDWAPYAEQMLEVLEAAEGLENTAPDGGYVARPAWRPLTKFEQRGQRLGHGVWDLLFRRNVC
jgi:tRNA (guanine-N7-)-methyltransferase